MATYAAGRGWRFEAEQPLLVDRFTGPPFGLGFGRRAYNVLYGSHDGRDLVSFDYEYKTPDLQREADHDPGAPVLGAGALHGHLTCPSLSVDPENFLERFVGRLTGNDIDLESEEFNRAFTVSCPDRKFASDVLHPQMMEFLLEHRQVGWRFERDSMLMVARRTAVRRRRSTRRSRSWTASPTGCPEFVWLRLKGQG